MSDEEISNGLIAKTYAMHAAGHITAEEGAFILMARSWRQQYDRQYLINQLLWLAMVGLAWAWALKGTR